MQTDVLDGGPDNGETTVLGGEDINLIGTLSHEAPQALDGIGRLNMPMHSYRKCVKGQGLLFLFSQASDRFGIAFAIFGEWTTAPSQLGLLPERDEFRLYKSALSPGNCIEDIVYGLRTS